ncbi:F0F1 ATP synthase subunit delta [Candidatus Uhrbacteria bacterium]|nr:F0F1 ATP synthase subunit delta [Candidatus Uhrbacteria bacterium]
MRKQNAKQFASALRALTRGKKKSEIDTIVRSVVGRYGVTGQMKFLARVWHQLHDILNSEKGVARVAVRVPSCDKKRNRALTGQIAKQVGRDSEISITEDPSLIAGAVVTVGDKRYDGSVKARIRQLRKHLQRN